MEVGVNTLRNVHRILVRRPRYRRVDLLRSYLYLRLRGAMLGPRLQLKQGLCEENLLGFKLTCFTYSQLIWLFEEIFVGKEYSFESSSRSPLIIDLGSNVGISIMFFKWLYPEARVIGFEADERTFAILKKNVERNQLKDVELHNVAVFDSEEDIKFYYDPQEPGSVRMSTMAGRLTRASRNVRSVLLSNYINGEVDFVKMDIEGAELRVIRELADHKKLKSISQMVLEYHHHISPESDELSQLLAVFEQNGFGYQLRSNPDRPFQKMKFQDVLIYAYRK